MSNWLLGKNPKSVSPQSLVNLGLIIFAIFSPFSIAGAQTGLWFALLGWAWKIIDRKILSWVSSFFELPVILYLGAFLLSIIFSRDRMASLNSLRDEWLLVIPFLLINNVKDEKFIRNLVNLVFITSAFVAIYAIWQHYTGIDLIRHKVLDLVLPYRKFRSVAFFNLPLTYAFYAMLIGIVSFCLGAYEKRPRWKIFYFAIAILCVTGNLFTYTRSTLLAQVIIFIFYFSLTKNPNKKNELLAVAGYFILIYLIDPGILGRSIMTVKAGSLEQADIRSVIWSTSFDIFTDYPIFGIGFGNFQEFYRMYLKVPSVIFEHAHNDFLNVAVNAGIIGLSAFIFFWVVILKNLLKKYKDKKEGYAKAFIFGGILTLLAYLLASQFQCYYTDAEDNMILFFILGLCATLARFPNRDIPSSS
ncbi:MAG: O-antigen ligase family protein [candidate division Zixibacteria bacterium]|nr:O-antigen ligase family protein [candidate division Zixibacteria bacterium]